MTRRRSFLRGGMALGLLPALATPALAQRDTASWLVEMPAPRRRGDAFAIILSGDGGWRDLDRQIGRHLRDTGVPVLGFDCLNWFWRRRSPEETA